MVSTSGWLGRTVRVVASCGAALALTGGAMAQSLQKEIQGLIGQNKLGNVSVGVSVVECASGDNLVSVNAGEPFTPASNLKLLTSGTALLVLGKDFKFATRFVRDGDRLVVVGSGDPGFADPKLLAEMGLPVDEFLDRIVGEIKRCGFSGIREVVIDERVFDDATIHPSWPTNQLNKWYCAPVEGMNFYTNVLEIYPTRGDRTGAPPNYRTSPGAPWIEIDNKARTVDNDNTALGVLHTDNDWRFTLFGNLKGAPEEPITVTVRKPGMMFGRLLADHLASAGMGVNGGVPTARTAMPDEKFAQRDVVAVVQTGMATLLKRTNTDSQNLYAESLIKRVGHEVTGQPGSWNNGAAIVRMQVADKLGPNAGILVLADGSGLSKDNQVTPGLLAHWLAALSRDKDPGVSQMFYESMVAADEGKLEKRFKDRKLQNELRAKTGFIAGVLGLSGYMTGPTGQRVSFSILVNAHRGAGLPAAEARKFQEDAVVAIDRWLSRQGGRRHEAEGKPRQSKEHARRTAPERGARDE